MSSVVGLSLGILSWTDESDFEEISGTEGIRERSGCGGEAFWIAWLTKNSFVTYHPSRGTVISASGRRLCDDFYSDGSM